MLAWKRGGGGCCCYWGSSRHRSFLGAIDGLLSKHGLGKCVTFLCPSDVGRYCFKDATTIYTKALKTWYFGNLYLVLASTVQIKIASTSSTPDLSHPTTALGVKQCCFFFACLSENAWMAYSGCKLTHGPRIYKRAFTSALR